MAGLNSIIHFHLRNFYVTQQWIMTPLDVKLSYLDIQYKQLRFVSFVSGNMSL